MSRAGNVARALIIRSGREGRKRNEGQQNTAVCGMTNGEEQNLHVVAKPVTGEAN